MTVLRSALDRENVTDSTGRSMCFTCFLGFFGSVGTSFSLLFSADDLPFSADDLPFSADDLLFSSDDFLDGSFGCSVESAGFSAPPSVVSSCIWHYI